jgi:hypothetical protein
MFEFDMKAKDSDQNFDSGKNITVALELGKARQC